MEVLLKSPIRTKFLLTWKKQNSDLKYRLAQNLNKQNINSGLMLNILPLPVSLRFTVPNLDSALAFLISWPTLMFMISVSYLKWTSDFPGQHLNTVLFLSLFLSIVGLLLWVRRIETWAWNQINLMNQNILFNGSQMFVYIKIMWVERECTNTDSTDASSPKLTHRYRMEHRNLHLIRRPDDFWCRWLMPVNLSLKLII